MAGVIVLVVSVILRFIEVVMLAVSISHRSGIYRTKDMSQVDTKFSLKQYYRDCSSSENDPSCSHWYTFHESVTHAHGAVWSFSDRDPSVVNVFNAMYTLVSLALVFSIIAMICTFFLFVYNFRQQGRSSVFNRVRFVLLIADILVFLFAVASISVLPAALPNAFYDDCVNKYPLSTAGSCNDFCPWTNSFAGSKTVLNVELKWGPLKSYSLCATVIALCIASLIVGFFLRWKQRPHEYQPQQNVVNSSLQSYGTAGAYAGGVYGAPGPEVGLEYQVQNVAPLASGAYTNDANAYGTGNVPPPYASTVAPSAPPLEE